jgi:hypothetical protein
MVFLIFAALIAFSTFVDVTVAIDNFENLRDSQYQKSEDFQQYSEGIPWHKAIKDVLFFAALALLLIQTCVQSKPLKVNKVMLSSFGALAGCLGLAFCIAAYKYGPVVAVIGLRSYWSILALLIGLSLSRNQVVQLIHLTGLLVMTEALFAIFQYAFGLLVLGAEFGYRSTGTFFEPNTFGLFGLSCVALLSIMNNRGTSWYVYLVSASVVIVLSGSRVAFLVLFVWCTAYIFLGVRSLPLKGMMAALAIPIASTGVYLSQAATGRAELLEQLVAPDNRIGILMSYIENASVPEIIGGNGLGIGSNVLHSMNTQSDSSLISKASGITFIADSVVTSTLAQGGLLLLIGAIMFLISPISLARRGEDIRGPILLPLIVLGAGTTNIIFEVAPFNFLAFAVYGWLANASNFNMRLSNITASSHRRMS